MFDFQKEVILNNIGEPIVKNDKDFIRIDGMTYKKKYMGTVYKTTHTEGTPAKLTFNMAKISTTNDLQFVIELGLDKDYRGDFGSVLYYFRKPIVVSIKAETSIEDIASAFKKASYTDYNLYKVEYTDATDQTIKLTMTDNYINVRNVEVFEIVKAADGIENYETLVSFETEDKKEPADKALIYDENVVGFGTYEYMIHNLRLPTTANMRFASPSEVEMPVKNGKYVQYSFEYTVPRRLGGLSVAGQNVSSTTIHTFFVLDSDTNITRFDSYMNTTGVNAVNGTDHDNHMELEDPEE
jgi:hypothetical protein